MKVKIRFVFQIHEGKGGTCQHTITFTVDGDGELSEAIDTYIGEMASKGWELKKHETILTTGET